MLPIMRSDPNLRMLVVLMLLLGGQNAAIYPYQSLIAIEHIGLSGTGFAALMALASVVSVGVSVLFGMLGDQCAWRRRLALITTLCGTAGLGMMAVAPAVGTLILCNGILLPVAFSLFGQAFGLSGLVLARQRAMRDGVQAVIRACLSAAFLAMLIFFTFAFGWGWAVTSIYPAAGVMSLGLILLVFFYWPKDGTTDWQSGPSGQSLLQSFGQIARPYILFRMALLGAVTSAGTVYIALVSLVLDISPIRDAGDVALYVGMVAGWEVPFMLLLYRFAARFSRTTLIGGGSLIYAVHLGLLPLVADSSALWLLPLFAGIGGAAMLTLPIGYYQDLRPDRAGAVGALIALQKMTGDLLAALIFGLGMGLGSYGITALLGCGMSLLGAFGLWLLDRYDLPFSGGAMPSPHSIG